MSTPSADPRSEPGVQRVTVAQLPLSCPLPDSPLWSSHPRVYLPIEATGAARCPYCGARYELEGGPRSHGH